MRKKHIQGIALILGMILFIQCFSSLKVNAAVTTDFITTKTDIDSILTRPYEANVPTGFSNMIFALHSTGWGFDANSIYRTGLTKKYGMECTVTINGQTVTPTKGTYRPSYVTTILDEMGQANLAGNASVTASYTSRYDTLAQINDGIINTSGNSPRSRWTNYYSASAPRTETEWILFDFGKEETLEQITLYPFSDSSNTAVPAKIEVQAYIGATYQTIVTLADLSKEKNDISFSAIATSKIKLLVTPQSGKAAGISEVELLGKASGDVRITEQKFITPNNMAISLLHFENISAQNQTVTIQANAALGSFSVQQDNAYVLMDADGFQKHTHSLSKTIVLAPKETADARIALAFASTEKEAKKNIRTLFQDTEPLETQKRSYLRWFKENVPYFECNDSSLTKIYYFRWLTYRSQIRQTADGDYIISEFLPNVSWAGADNAIPCPAMHHFYEGRWIKNTTYLNDYMGYWFKEDSKPRSYSFPIADAYYANYLVQGNTDNLIAHLPDLMENYEAWVAEKYSDDDGLFYQHTNQDGMEYSISGSGYRPTINSYMYADAVAISKIAKLAEDQNTAENYKQCAEIQKQAVLGKLWNSEHGFFETLKQNTLTFANVRELIGYIPWCYNLPEDTAVYSAAFSQLTDESGFKAPYGPTTAERRHEKFLAPVSGGNCHWNGPSWPFATSQVLTAAANLLNNYTVTEAFNANDYWKLLTTYANSHYKTSAVDGEKYCWLAEDLNPLTGEWLADFERSIYYNHSSFNDLIITGLVGIRPAENDRFLTIHPLIPEEGLDYFILENIEYRGRTLTVTYDQKGERYTKGISVYVNGQLQTEGSDAAQVEVFLPSFIAGDLNGDKNIDLLDVVLLLRKLNGTLYDQEINLKAANVVNTHEAENEVNTADIVYLLKYITGVYKDGRPIELLYSEETPDLIQTE